MVAYTSLAFGVVGIIASACCKDVDAKMNNKVWAHIMMCNNLLSLTFM